MFTSARSLKVCLRQPPALSFRSWLSTVSDSLSLGIETVPLAHDLHKAPKESTKSPLLILHGLFGSKMNNRTISKQLATILNRDVYCLDLRNHGDSPHHQRHDYPALAADVEQFCLIHRLDKPILVGHSMGAKTVMAAALRRPDLAQMMISVDNAPVDFTHGATGFSKFGKYVKQLIKITNQRHPILKTMKEADAVLKEVEDSLPVRQFLLTNIKRDAKAAEGDLVLKAKVPLEILGKTLQNISAFPFDPDQRHWSGPSLFVRGEKSSYVSDEMMPEIGRFFPAFQTKDIDAGHWLISEKPKEFVDIVCEWIERMEDA